MLKELLVPFVNPMGKRNFIRHLPPNSKFLDVGCGNNSPFQIKQMLPACEYTGIDIGDYNQTKPNLADRYILTDPEHFPEEIARHAGEFDAVMSAHNFEHCNDRPGTLSAMIKALKPGGMLYMAFPSQYATKLPHRGGTLNYYDDDTHKSAPPDVRKIRIMLAEKGMEIVKLCNPYRPLVLRLVGLLQEPTSRRKNLVLKGTWALYGFETVIWARKPVAAATNQSLLGES